MGKKLTVVVGAGASYDLVAYNVGVVIETHRPPLTAQLFNLGLGGLTGAQLVAFR